MIPLHLLHLSGWRILDQLHLEEALLAHTTENWCLINEGSPPAIVLGVSGKEAELIHLDEVEARPIPVVRRCSGGGTVVVDRDTLFVSFLFHKGAHSFAPYPEPILQWSADLYRGLFPENFALRERDYVLGERKFGGNAQYIQREKWLHHTSFLWDFQAERMRYLLYPKRTPNYRAGRSHEEFLCKLSEVFPDRKGWIASLLAQLDQRYDLHMRSVDEVSSLVHLSPRRAATVAIRNLARSGA